ncbi:MAG: hypothetical protein EA350_10670, partial [Gemmatimonadales bacterium]
MLRALRSYRTRVLLPATLVLAGGGLTACVDDADTLVVYTPHGRDLLAHFGQAFEEANPGVRIEWLDMGSQEVL